MARAFLAPRVVFGREVANPAQGYKFRCPARRGTLNYTFCICHLRSSPTVLVVYQIIPHEGTSDAAAAAAVDVGGRQGKTCIVVKDVPGFYVNR